MSGSLVSLVTGGSRGIGLAVARGLAARGDRVALLARSAEGLRRAREEVAARGGAPFTFAVDVCDEEGVERAFGAVVEELGRLDLVVHCAGVLETGRFDEIPSNEYRRVMEVNYLGSVNVARAALRHMLARGGGHLVQVASAIAIRTFPGFAAYAPSKWALRAFHETLESELRGSPVRLSIVYPPITDTPMVRETPADRRPAIYAAFSAVPAERVASAILRGVLKGRRRIFARRIDRIYFHLARLAPGAVGRILDGYVARFDRPRRAGPLP